MLSSLRLSFRLLTACALTAIAVRAADASAGFAVAVFCGASEHVDAKYFDAARKIGDEIGARHWTLVWGGSKDGSMGAVASGVKDAHGKLIGIYPQFFQAWGDIEFHGTDAMYLTDTIGQRKAAVQARADAFVVLPGGCGTMDELFDTLELRQVDRMTKPILLFNQDGYYDKLLGFIDWTIDQKFSDKNAREHLIVVRSIEELVGQLEKIAAAKEEKK